MKLDENKYYGVLIVCMLRYPEMGGGDRKGRIPVKTKGERKRKFWGHEILYKDVSQMS